MLKRYAFFGLLLAVLMACSPAGDEDDAPETTTPSVEAPAYPAETNATPNVTAVPATVPTSAHAKLPDLGPAPAWKNTQWINSEALPLPDLRGKVVLLEFWTFG